MKMAHPETPRNKRGMAARSAQGLPQKRLPRRTSTNTTMDIIKNIAPRKAPKPAARIPKRKNLWFTFADFEFSGSLPFPEQPGCSTQMVFVVISIANL